MFSWLAQAQVSHAPWTNAKPSWIVASPMDYAGCQASASGLTSLQAPRRLASLQDLRRLTSLNEQANKPARSLRFYLQACMARGHSKGLHACCLILCLWPAQAQAGYTALCLCLGSWPGPSQAAKPQRAG